MTPNDKPIYKDTSYSFKERARDLVSRMTIDEKVSQTLNNAPGIDRLGVPPYNWWNECLHGVARAGVATVFPQAIGLAAMWNEDLMFTVADVISTEGRAKHHEAVRQGDFSIYRGLTFWTPNINIFRDPRWGRGHETYGEDPYLTGRLGVAFVKGLQGDDPKYLKSVATPKHFAVHSGPEKDRHHFDAVVGQKDLWETYLPAFQACVQEAKAVSVMGAYNRTNGEPCCASKTLLIDILREKWGFDGYVVSDCGAIDDIHNHHQITKCTAESAALSVKNGCDLECGCVYASLLSAVAKDLISEEEIDTAVTRLMEARMRLGMFDPDEMVPYAKIPYEVNDCEEHRKLALRAARESIVLLKNEPYGQDRPLLPLSKDLKTVAVIGPNANFLDVLLGNYAGLPSEYVTPLDGIRNKLQGTKVLYAKGCELLGDSTHGFSEAVSAAERSDAVIMCLGLSPAIEGEEGDAYNSDAGGDKTHLDLTGPQQALLERILATGKPVVLVIISGSATAPNWAHANVPAIIQAFYPGEEGGTAIADVIFGDYNPAGRLPVTYVKSLSDLPPFEDYNMKGRTYRYIECEPLYPFGFGLSYTTFSYGDIALSSDTVKSGESLQAAVKVTNTGRLAGDEVVELYLTDLEASVVVPTRKLIGFKRISLAAGESKEVTFTITPELMSLVDNDGNTVLEPGRFQITIGGCQGDDRSLTLGMSKVASAEFEVK